MESRQVTALEPTGLELSLRAHQPVRARNLVPARIHHMHEIPPEVSRVILLKAGRIMADGDKAHVLTQQRLSALFDVPLQLVQASGWYQALPA